MRSAGCDSAEAAWGCVDALRESVPALRPQELLDALCGVEVLARKTHAAMLELVAGLDAAGLAAAQGFGNTGRLLAALLDCGTGQARARVREAEQLATRRTLTGEVLPARLPATAAALAAGEVGTGALQVIAQTMAQLPSTVSQDDRDQIEATLAQHARDFDPRQLGVIARRILDQLDPDGTPPLQEPDDPCPAAGELRIRDRRDGGISLDAEHWSPATADVPSRAATARQHCVMPITFANGTRGATPRLATASCSAPRITAGYTPPDGTSPSAETSSSSSHPPFSTPIENHSPTHSGADLPHR
jgi:hypothetical protein